jgi:hypothetical protein
MDDLTMRKLNHFFLSVDATYKGSTEVCGVEYQTWVVPEKEYASVRHMVETTYPKEKIILEKAPEKKKPRSLRILLAWCKWRLELARRRREFEDAVDAVRASRHERTFKGMLMLELTTKLTEAKTRLVEWEAMW